MTVQRVERAAHPAIDCFYVYPTVSSEPTGNSDLKIGLAEIVVAQVQAARFSQVCRVYAPMYRQITNRGLDEPALHADPVRGLRRRARGLARLPGPTTTTAAASC